jgi:hypothetical protein
LPVVALQTSQAHFIQRRLGLNFKMNYFFAIKISDGSASLDNYVILGLNPNSKLPEDAFVFVYT